MVAVTAYGCRVFSVSGSGLCVIAIVNGSASVATTATATWMFSFMKSKLLSERPTTSCVVWM